MVLNSNFLEEPEVNKDITQIDISTPVVVETIEVEADDDTSDSESSTPKFPDTQIKIEHSERTKINVIAEPVKSLQEQNVSFKDIDHEPKKREETRKKPKGQNKQNNKKNVVKEEKDENSKLAPIKRGQKK